MNWWQSLIIGLVEGLTEYLPVSSTGHIILTQRVMGIVQSDAADAFAVCVQGGAIMAVIGLYWARVKQMTMGILGKDWEGLVLVRNLVLAFLPAAVAGLLFSKKIKALLFGLPPISAAWLIGGVAILLVSAWQKKKQESKGEPAAAGNPIERLTMLQAVAIGVIQCVAMCPGTSRSLMVLVGGLLVGLSLSAAVEFSFLLGLLTLGAATAKDAKEHGALMLQEYGPLSLTIGFVAAWISAVLAIKWMVGYLKRKPLTIFGWYRIGLGGAVAILLSMGRL